MSGNGQTGGGGQTRMRTGRNRMNAGVRTSWNPTGDGGGNRPWSGIADTLKNIDWPNIDMQDFDLGGIFSGMSGGGGQQAPRVPNPLWPGNWQGPAGQNPISQYYAHPEAFTNGMPPTGRFLPPGPAPAPPWDDLQERMDRIGDPFERALAHLRRRFPNAR